MGEKEMEKYTLECGCVAEVYTSGRAFFRQLCNTHKKTYYDDVLGHLKWLHKTLGLEPRESI